MTDIPKKIDENNKVLESPLHINDMSFVKIITILSHKLALLDRSLSSSSKDSLSLSDLENGYFLLLKGFKNFGMVENSIFIYSYCLSVKVISKLKQSYKFNQGEFLLVYAGVLLLSIKLLHDYENWLIEDFSEATGLEKKEVQDIELFVFSEALNFNPCIDQSIFDKEIKFFVSKD